MILVTGATGLTGHFVTRELLRRGHAVRVLCRGEAAARTWPAGVEVALGDLGDPDSLAQAVRGTSGVVHAACTYTDSAVDVAAMTALVGGWRKGPFVFLSSLDVYGLASGVVTEETAVCESYDDYSRGKVVCERLLAGAAAGGGAVMLRAPYIWGPHPTARRRLLGKRLLGGEPLVLPEGDGFEDAWVDVRDLATIVAECVARPGGGAMNVVTGHFAWRDLFARLIRLTGSRSAIVQRPLDAIAEEELPRKQIYAQRWHFSEDKLERTLGRIPRRSFEETVRDTVSEAAPG